MIDVGKIFDEGSFIELSKGVSENVIIGYGTINNKLCYAISDTGKYIDDLYVSKVMKLYTLAIETGAPVIYMVDNNGIDITEGAKSLNLYGQILQIQSVASGRVVQIAVVCGNAFGGTNIIANHCDFVFVEKNAGKIWTVLPMAIKGTEPETKSVKMERNFMIDGILEEDEICSQIHELVSMLPSNYNDKNTYIECTDDLNRKVNIDGLTPNEVVREIADDHKDIEIKKEFAHGVYTGFIRLNGNTIGVIASKKDDKKVTKKQIRKLKKFITFLDAFSIPILTITIARDFGIETSDDQDLSVYAADLTYCYVNATVPKVTIVREAVGMAGLLMGSKSMGADLVYAYDDSKLQVMDSEELTRLLYDDEINAASDKLKVLEEKKQEIREKYSLESALKDYVIDDIIAKEDTRQIIISAFELLYTKKVDKISKKHGAF